MSADSTFAAFKQRRPDAWESRAHRADVEHTYAVTGGLSPDGLRWTRLPEPLVVDHRDTQPVCTFDAQLGRYVLHTRNWSVGPRAEGAPDDRGLSLGPAFPCPAHSHDSSADPTS